MGVTSLWVPGRPVPQGSKRVINGRLIDVNHSELSFWRAEVARGMYALDSPVLTGPVSVTLDFFFARPQGHFGKKGLRKSAPKHPAVRPDLDKLVRAVLDALTGVAFRDDAQVVTLTARKRYCEDNVSPGLRVEITNLAPSEADATLTGERSK